MLDETHFHAMANATLMHCYDQLEDAFERGEIEELDLEEGILTIEVADGKKFILSKHTASRQLWLASPFSGGLHFAYSVESQRWVDAADLVLYEVLRRDLHRAGTEVIL